MKLIKSIILLILMNFLQSCGGASDVGKVLRNEKTNTTDEFFVKKREPLTLPPEYNKIPEPGSVKQNTDEKNQVNKILNIKEEDSSNSKSSSVEQSVINQIRK